MDRSFEFAMSAKFVLGSYAHNLSSKIVHKTPIAIINKIIITYIDNNIKIDFIIINPPNTYKTQVLHLLYLQDVWCHHCKEYNIYKQNQ